MKKLFVLWALVLGLGIVGCQPSPPESTNEPETSVLFTLLDDGYGAATCNHPTKTTIIDGGLRCKKITVTEEILSNGEFWYLLDLVDCELPLFGKDWTCEAALWWTPPLDE